MAKRKKQKREHLATIDPNTIRTRVCLDNKPAVHKDKKREQKKYKARGKVKAYV